MMTPDLLIRIGSALAERHSEVIVGKDIRTSGDMASLALAAGLAAGGASCHLAGLVTTPTLARCTADCDAGVMVTASHNPPEYNGVKLWNPDGSAFSSEQMREVESRVGKAMRGVPWREIGAVRRRKGCIREHMEAVLASLPGAVLSVVVDCGNGSASLITPELLRRMGCRVLTLNCQPDGHFPGRPSEPSEENLLDLKRAVIMRGADLGIAHDGDGDRMVAVDANGRYVGGDALLAIFSRRFAEGDVVAPINASMVLDEIVRGRVVRTKVGDVFVSDALKREGIRFGGEPSGTFIFSEQTFCPDGVYAAALLTVMATESPLSEMADSIPSYPSATISFPFREEERAKIEGRLGGEMETLECARLITDDGFRAEFDDGWFLIRLSGTEPKMRVTAEARNEADLGELMTLAKRIAGRCLG